ncbi:NYN domain protein [Arthrobacter sp. YC-RL1]|uniref:NYN domain-containing protein n=1 Tax=Arthrobacter sp. YC-RL1 TaxID=1652545 RepID=UPI00063DC6FC|nr:NYN domain-containing protein [Arthrobacter sp. YC-RL1]ALQ32385.1 NYN domain protein [Arthrobacter sp. YC-RL1]KLI89504.1 NYN domain protein [Arthrobacter sp. YC-RL1]
MPSQTAIFIDAGFLLSLGGHRAAGTTLRSAFTTHYESLIRGIVQSVKKNSGLSNLRVYWYDASKDGLFTEQHKRIGLISGVKVRLGRISYNGEQKGVDLRLALDLVGVARTRAASIAYLVSGDDDLAEAVEEAQDLGMKVVLLGVNKPESRLGVASVAEHLALTADAIETIPDQLLDSAFTRVIEWDQAHSEKSALIAKAAPSPVHGNSEARPSVPTPAIMAQKAVQQDSAEPMTRVEIVYSSGTGGQGYQGNAAYEQNELATAEEIGGRVAESWLAVTTQAEVLELLADKPQLPLEIDRTLLKDCAQVLGEWTTDQQKIRRVLRSAFWEYLDRLM